jgi:two-component system phosphate regulon sensor histidine kinase PhoR
MAIDAQSPQAVRLRVFFILLSSFLVMIAAGAVSVGYSVHRSWEDTLRVEITRSLTEKARMFAARVNTDHDHKIQDIVAQEALAAGARATVVDTNGKVIADSEVQPSALENEGRRAEFVSALRGETGVVTRKRNEFAMPILNVAVPVSGGAVRLAYPLADIDIATAHARRILFIGAAVAVLAALAISWIAAVTLTARTADV